MPNYNISVTAGYKPFTFDELAKPLLLYKAEYDKQLDAAMQLGDEAAKRLNMLDPVLDKEKYDAYKAIADDVYSIADDITAHGLKGYSADRAVRARRNYQALATPLDYALARREKEREFFLKMKLEHPDMEMSRDPYNTAVSDYYPDANLGELATISRNSIRDKVTKSAAAFAGQFSRTDIERLNDLFYEYVDEKGLKGDPDAIMAKYPEFEKIVEEAEKSANIDAFSPGAKDRIRASILSGIKDGIMAAYSKKTTPIKDDIAVAEAKAAAKAARTGSGSLAGVDYLDAIGSTYDTTDNSIIAETSSEVRSAPKEVLDFLTSDKNFDTDEVERYVSGGYGAPTAVMKRANLYTPITVNGEKDYKLNLNALSKANPNQARYMKETFKALGIDIQDGMLLSDLKKAVNESAGEREEIEVDSQGNITVVSKPGNTNLSELNTFTLNLFDADVKPAINKLTAQFDTYQPHQEDIIARQFYSRRFNPGTVQPIEKVTQSKNGEVLDFSVRDDTRSGKFYEDEIEQALSPEIQISLVKGKPGLIINTGNKKNNEKPRLFYIPLSALQKKSNGFTNLLSESYENDKLTTWAKTANRTVTVNGSKIPIDRILRQEDIPVIQEIQRLDKLIETIKVDPRLTAEQKQDYIKKAKSRRNYFRSKKLSSGIGNVTAGEAADTFEAKHFYNELKDNLSAAFENSYMSGYKKQGYSPTITAAQRAKVGGGSDYVTMDQLSDMFEDIYE